MDEISYSQTFYMCHYAQSTVVQLQIPPKTMTSTKSRISMDTVKLENSKSWKTLNSNARQLQSLISNQAQKPIKND